MEKETKELAETKYKMKRKEKDSCADAQCPIHGSLKSRGRIFKGYVIKKFPRRIVIELERIVPIRKYERYTKKKTKLHARMPLCKEGEVNIGDYVIVQECRPLSKLIHFVYLREIKEAERKLGEVNSEK